MSDLTRSDGLLIPKGQFTSFLARPMARDAEDHENPETFD